MERKVYRIAKNRNNMSKDVKDRKVFKEAKLRYQIKEVLEKYFEKVGEVKEEGEEAESQLRVSAVTEEEVEAVPVGSNIDGWYTKV